MSARTLTDDDARAIAVAIVRELAKTREAEKAAKARGAEREPVRHVSDTDRAAARAIARRLGLHVRTRASK